MVVPTAPAAPLPAAGSGPVSTPRCARRPTPPPTPLLVVDLDAFDANAADLVRRAGGTPIRVCLEVAAGAGADPPGPGARRVPRASSPTRCAEALWLRGAGDQRRPAGRLPHRRPRRAGRRWSPRPRAAAAHHADGRRRGPPRRRRLGARPRGPSRCGSRSTSTPVCAWAGSTSARSARPLHDVDEVLAARPGGASSRPGFTPGRCDDLRGPGRRRPRRRADRARPVAGRAPVEGASLTQLAERRARSSPTP